MLIEQNKVVLFHYRLSDEQGEAIENSYDGDPVAYLHGHRNIIQGLEQAMLGKQAGDSFETTVPPEMGYGLHKENHGQRIPIKHLLTKGRLKPGMIVSVQTEHGPRQVTVVKVGKFNVDVDTNHPFAGKVLHFAVEIVDVRDASKEEIAHGHAHGVGGHHHH